MDTPIEKTDLKDRGSNRHQNIKKGDHSPVVLEIKDLHNQLEKKDDDYIKQIQKLEETELEKIEAIEVEFSQLKVKTKEVYLKEKQILSETIKQKSDLLNMAVKDDFSQATQEAKEIAEKLKYKRVNYQGETETDWMFMLTELDKEKVKEEFNKE